MLSAVSGEPFIQDKTELSRQESLIHPSIHSFTQSYNRYLPSASMYQVPFLGTVQGTKKTTPCSHQTDVLVGREFTVKKCQR